MSEAIHFAMKHIEDVSWAQLNVLTQTRRNIQHEGIDELARAIEAVDKGGVPRNELFHPIMINSLDAESAQLYISDLNLCHGTSHSLDQLVLGADGRYNVVIAGHRRRLASGKLIEKYGADPGDSTVPCSIHDNLSFKDALRKQIDENTHQSLSVTEVARAIQATYRYGTSTGDYTSIADCVRDLPFGDEKIRGALKFCELPDVIQDWVEDERLAYGAAVALHPLMEGLRKYYGELAEPEREGIVMEYMLAYGLKIINHQWSKDIVRNQVNELLESRRSDQQLLLFQQDEYLVASRYRQQATRELFNGGINRLRQFRETSVYKDLPIEQREAMIQELKTLVLALGGTAVLAVDDAPLMLEYAN